MRPIRASGGQFETMTLVFNGLRILCLVIGIDSL